MQDRKSKRQLAKQRRMLEKAGDATREKLVRTFRTGRDLQALAQELQLEPELIVKELIDDFLHYARQIESLLTQPPDILRHLALARLVETLCSPSVSEKTRLTAIQLVLRFLRTLEPTSTSPDGLSTLRQLFVEDQQDE